jgi:hypothetical protein
MVIYTFLYRRDRPPEVAPSVERADGGNLAGNMGLIISLNRLTEAIVNSYKEHNMSREDAQNMAYHVLNFFGFGDRIVDNVLEPEDRDLFYMLEDFGLLVTEREETTLYDGREWRIHYWLLKKNAIEYMSCGDGVNCPTGDEDYNIYEDIPDDVWMRPS